MNENKKKQVKLINKNKKQAKLIKKKKTRVEKKKDINIGDDKIGRGQLVLEMMRKLVSKFLSIWSAFFEQFDLTQVTKKWIVFKHLISGEWNRSIFIFCDHYFCLLFVFYSQLEQMGFD